MITNILLLLLEVVITFGGVVFLAKYFKSAGLFAWAAIAPIIANLQLVKIVTSPLGGVPLGSVMFASTFLATDIFTECFEEKEAKKVPWISGISVIVHLLFTQLAVHFVPDSSDVMQPVLEAYFFVQMRVCIASVFFMVLANYVDVIIYSLFKKHFKEKKMWLRNNVCTIVCNCLENYGFAFVALYGILDVKGCLISATIGSIIETAIALLDTPFLYLSKKLVK